jgi:hypothetical protein
MLWAAGLLFQMGMLAGRGEVVHRLDKTAADQSDDEPGRSTKMKGNDDKVESLDRTVLRVGDADVSLTLDDAKAMRVALLDYLKRSDYEDRDALIRWTGPAFIDTAGTVRIGPWVLGSQGKDIFLRYREPPLPQAGKAHKATLTRKDGTWTVSNLVLERIRPRR